MPLTKVSKIVSNLPSRNYIINGQMQVAQRGMGPFTANVYTVDRWRLRFVSAATESASQVVLTDWPDIEKPEHALYTEVTNQTSSDHFCLHSQHIEDPIRLSGKKLTLSFDLWSSISGNVACRLDRHYGTGGDVYEYGTAQKQAINVGWNRIEMTFDSFDWTTKLIGTGPALGVLIALSTGSDYDSLWASLGLQNGNFNLANVKLEAGPVATPFSPRDIVEDLFLCKRYYEIGSFIIRGQAYNVSSGMTVPISYNVEKRVLATIAFPYKYDGLSNSDVTTEGAYITGFNAKVFPTDATLDVYMSANWTAESEFYF